MKVKGIDIDSGKEVEVEIKDPGHGFFRAMNEFDMSDDFIKKNIDALNISADAKLFFYRLSKATIRFGSYIVKVGQKILDVVFQIVREFRMATIGTIFGLIAGFLIHSIPIFGLFLGPIVTPILMAIGFIGGTAIDLQGKMLEKKIADKIAEQDEFIRQRISERLAEFAPLAPA